MSQPTTIRALPEVAAIMKHINDTFPEMRRALKEPGKGRILHDIIAAGIGSAVSRSQPTLEQSVATVMAAGYHVTSQPVNVTPIRKREPGTQTMPSAENQLGYVTPDSQRGRLLLAYLEAGEAGLTDEEARISAGIAERSNWWKRCGELRAAGLIQVMQDEFENAVTRVGSSGTSRIVCTITLEGRAVASNFE
jgi:hypothetical protein